MAELNELADKIAKIKQEVQTELEKLENSKSVYEYKKVILDGKTGKIGSLMKEMGKIPNELKADYGKKVNELKTWAQASFDELDTKFKEQEMQVTFLIQ